VACVPRKCHAEGRHDGEDARLCGDQQVRDGDVNQVAPYHQKQAHASDFRSLVAAERQSKLVSAVQSRDFQEAYCSSKPFLLLGRRGGKR
jgi:hypothetical protein